MQGRLQELSDSVGSVSKRMETIVANSDELTKACHFFIHHDIKYMRVEIIFHEKK
jgi:hypothetical protein